MFTATNLFEKELQKLVKEEISRVLHNLSLGYVEDYAAYKKIVGYLEALRWLEDTALEEVARTVHERTM